MSEEVESEALSGWMLVLFGVISVIAASMIVSGQPQGASITASSTEGSPSPNPANRTDDGGTINFLELNTLQQNNGWKAYVGNVTGRLTLDDSGGNTIYDWDLGSSPSGEVYISRDNSVTWDNITCANQTIITNEDNFLGNSLSDSDSINSTFDKNAHAEMQIGGESVSQDNCRSTATYVNDTAQTVDANATFQEILLQDVDDDLVYATFIDQDSSSYKNTTNTTYDFQAIVGENSTAETPQSYYFYLEIS